MHCEEPGCLAACPAPGAIVQYANGIVDVNPDQCIGCGYCETGCPFDVPRFHADDRQDGQVHALRGPDVQWAWSRLASRRARPDASSSAPRTTCSRWDKLRVDQLKANGFADAALVRPDRGRRDGRRHGPRPRRPPGVVRPAGRSARSAARQVLEVGAAAARRRRHLRRRARRLRATTPNTGASRSRGPTPDTNLPAGYREGGHMTRAAAHRRHADPAVIAASEAGRRRRRQRDRPPRPRLRG